MIKSLVARSQQAALHVSFPIHSSVKIYALYLND